MEEIAIPIVQTDIQDEDGIGMWANLGDMMAERLAADQLNPSYQVEQAGNASLVQQAVPGPTGPNPSVDQYPGDYKFKVKFHRLSDNIKNKSWDVSCSYFIFYLAFSLPILRF